MWENYYNDKRIIQYLITWENVIWHNQQEKMQVRNCVKHCSNDLLCTAMWIFFLGHEVVHVESVQSIRHLQLVVGAQPFFPISRVHFFGVGVVEESCMAENLITLVAQRHS